MKPYPSPHPGALPPSTPSPCCLMFQFGGSKHSIRQINCLMHVISQTVYERGPLGLLLLPPQPPSLPPCPSPSPRSARAHCRLSYTVARPARSLTPARQGARSDAVRNWGTRMRSFICASGTYRHVYGNANNMHGQRRKGICIYTYRYGGVCLHRPLSI